jgi:hypothetical protein
MAIREDLDRANEFVASLPRAGLVALGTLAGGAFFFAAYSVIRWEGALSKVLMIADMAVVAGAVGSHLLYRRRRKGPPPPPFSMAQRNKRIVSALAIAAAILLTSFGVWGVIAQEQAR